MTDGIGLARSTEDRVRILESLTLDDAAALLANLGWHVGDFIWHKVAG